MKGKGRGGKQREGKGTEGKLKAKQNKTTSHSNVPGNYSTCSVIHCGCVGSQRVHQEGVSGFALNHFRRMIEQ